MLNKKIIFIMVILNIVCPAEVYAKTILITASTSYFGEAISLQLASEGYDLILAGRNQEKLNTLKGKILKKSDKTKINTVYIDFSKLQTIKKLTTNLESEKIDGIVLIAPRPELSKTNIPSPEEWEKVFKETFIAPLECIRLFEPFTNDNSSIVIISGNSSKEYLPNYPNVNVIRLAWTGEIKNLAHFMSSRKIRVNAISPGLILTPYHIERITKEAKNNHLTFEEQLQKRTAAIPSGRYGSLADVSSLVSFLLSKQSTQINSSNITLDGGQSNVY
jgi:3-oxoacyl-[acyl-carrier protein] reductase